VTAWRRSGRDVGQFTPTLPIHAKASSLNAMRVPLCRHPGEGRDPLNEIKMDPGLCRGDDH